MFLYERIVYGLKFLFACPNNSPAPSDAEFDSSTGKIGDDTLVKINIGDDVIPQMLFSQTTIPRYYEDPKKIFALPMEQQLPYINMLLSFIPTGTTEMVLDFNGINYTVDFSDGSYHIATEEEIQTFSAMMKNNRYKFYYQKLLSLYCNTTPNSTISVQIPTVDDANITPMVGSATLFEWLNRTSYTVIVDTHSDAESPTLSVHLETDGKEIKSGAYVEKGTIISGTVEYTEGYALNIANITIGDNDPIALTLTDNNTKFEITIQDNTKIYISEDYLS